MGLYLLIDEPPIQVSPTLASILGLNEAIALQQLHYWLVHNKRDPAKKKTHYRNNRWWAFNTYSEWQSNNFIFWSIPTVKRAFSSLEGKKDKSGNSLVISAQFNRKEGDCTKWYSINYEVLKILVNPSDQSDPTPSDQSDPTPSDQRPPRINLIPPSDQFDPTPEIKLIPSIYKETETTNRDYTEITTPPNPQRGDARAKNQNPERGGMTWQEVMDQDESDLLPLDLKYTEQKQPEQLTAAPAKINSSALTTAQQSVVLEEKPVSAATFEDASQRLERLRDLVDALPSGQILNGLVDEWRMQGLIVWYENRTTRISKEFLAYVAPTLPANGANPIQKARSNIRNALKTTDALIKMIELYEDFLSGIPSMGWTQADQKAVSTRARTVAAIQDLGTSRFDF